MAAALDSYGAPANVSAAARALKHNQVVYFGVSLLRVDILGSASQSRHAGTMTHGHGSPPKDLDQARPPVVGVACREGAGVVGLDGAR